MSKNWLIIVFISGLMVAYFYKQDKPQPTFILNQGKFVEKTDNEQTTNTVEPVQAEVNQQIEKAKSEIAKIEQLNEKDLEKIAIDQFNLEMKIEKTEDGDVKEIHFTNRIPAEVPGPSPAFPPMFWDKKLEPVVVNIKKRIILY